MNLIRDLLCLDDPLDEEISLRVRPIKHGGFGVYANEVVLAIHHHQTDAEAHCQRLTEQQRNDERVPS